MSEDESGPQSATIIQFPIQNKRFDLSNISVDPEAVAAEIRMMKLAYFAEVADNILDDTLRSMSMLNLESGKSGTNPIDHKDIILMKESIISGLCRIVGLDHPLHKILNEELVMTQVETEDQGEQVTITGYHFKVHD